MLLSNPSDVDAPAPELGLLGRSPLLAQLRGLPVPVTRELAPERRHRLRLGGRHLDIAQPVTFTPFASAQPCSARCRFCSETLVHLGATQLSATLRPTKHYIDQLARALSALTELPLGLSLSGLEATDDADWFAAVLHELSEWQRSARVTERVLYSNGAGLSPTTTGPRLLSALDALGLDRFELSRHSPDGAANQRIMRFRPGVAVADQQSWESVVRAAREVAPTRMVCVLQRGGVQDLEGVGAYLALADRLGVDDVVFRELSRLGDLYRPGATTRYVAAARVPIETLLEPLLPKLGGPDWQATALTAGYYYWNLRTRWRGRIGVTFETSDYEEMKRRHASDVVYKLVLHANGNLCADWDPNTHVLLRTGP